jgi:hypothetical protein
MIGEGAAAPGSEGAPSETIENQVVILDYKDFQNKRFFNCKLVYQGGRPPRLANNVFEECEFIFEGPALNTVLFLRILAQSTGGGAKEFVLQEMLGIK